MINAAQCRAARGLVDLSTEQLAEHSGVLEDTLLEFERGGELGPSAVKAVGRALEAAGAHFLPERGARGAGVRFKFSRQSVKRVDVWENEGGPAGEDDYH